VTAVRSRPPPTPRKDFLVLSDLAGDVVWLVCNKCGRKGRDRVAGLIAKYGADKKLTYLRAEIADRPKAYTASSRNIYDICDARWRSSASNNG
jgi:hypothetical protein